MVEAPDILYNETSNDTIVPEGSGVRLHCEARGFPEPTVTWRREDGALIALRGKVQSNTKRGTKTNTHMCVAVLSTAWLQLERKFN